MRKHAVRSKGKYPAAQEDAAATNTHTCYRLNQEAIMARKKNR